MNGLKFYVLQEIGVFFPLLRERRFKLGLRALVKTSTNSPVLEGGDAVSMTYVNFFSSLFSFSRSSNSFNTLLLKQSA